MPRDRYDLDSIDAQLRDYGLDDADEALLEHVLGDDRPPQGLHQQGVRDEPSPPAPRKPWQPVYRS